MFALTIQNPWPFAFMKLGKDLENRRWAPRPSRLHVGDVFALHATDTFSPAVWHTRFEDLEVEASKCGLEALRLLRDDYRGYRGIFALARFGGVVSRSDSPWFIGPKAWVISELRPIRHPVPCRGAQGLWRIPERVETIIWKTEAYRASKCALKS